ncbi:hypothetical protein, partial [Bacillus cereus]
HLYYVRKNNVFLYLGVVKSLKLMGMYGEALKEVSVYFESTKEKRRKFNPVFFLNPYYYTPKNPVGMAGRIIVPAIPTP